MVYFSCMYEGSVTKDYASKVKKMPIETNFPPPC